MCVCVCERGWEGEMYNTGNSGTCLAMNDSLSTVD